MAGWLGGQRLLGGHGDDLGLGGSLDVRDVLDAILGDVLAGGQVGAGQRGVLHPQGADVVVLGGALDGEDGAVGTGLGCG